MNTATRLLAAALVAGLAAPAAIASTAQARPPAAKTAKARADKPARAPAAPAAVSLPEADEAQRTAAEQTHFGDYLCEFGEQVRVQRNARHEGYVDVQHRQSTWTMKPVVSRTGALRLEDVRGRILLLQIASKSMLMDTRIGQRMVDNCVHDHQRHVAPPSPEHSLGIEPSRGSATAPS